MIRLTQTKIAVDGIPDPDTSLGGIIIPDQAKSRTKQGIVKYVGPDVTRVKIGDHVVFSGYTGTTVFIEGEGALIILPEDFVTCILESADTDIPGLYFKGTDGQFFTATYEMAIQIIAEHFRTSLRFAEVAKIKDVNPTDLSDTDYAKLH